MFFQINGSNGASFFFSAASFADWRKSLAFYQGVSWLAKAKKVLLIAAYPVLRRKAAMSGIEVAEALKAILPCEVEITIGEHDSAMISPTRDKMIIHHHGRSYEKFATGKSLDGVRRELEFYRSLQANPPKHFVVSDLLHSDENSEMVRFEMGYISLRKKDDDDIPLTAYAEFFQRIQISSVSWKSCWARLQLPWSVSNSDLAGETQVGAVHHDFKPWNVKYGSIPQFFDFESVAPGLPLEDFFNFSVDPALHFCSARECMRILQECGTFESAKKLLALQGISPDEMGRYWRWYLAERYDFFTKTQNQDLAKKFLELYHLPYAAETSRWTNVLSVAGIMLAALLLRLYYAAVHPIQSRDATGYLLLIQRWFAEGAGDYLNARPPLFGYFSRALMFCGLEAETAALTVNITAGTVLIIPLYLAGRAIWKKHSIALSVAALGAVMPNLIRFSCCALRDGLYLHFVAWSIALWTMTIRCTEEKLNFGYLWSFLCGAAIASGCMCRYEMAFFMPYAAISLFVVVLIQRAWKRAIGLCFCFGLGVIAGIVFWTVMPGMPNIFGTYLDRIRVNFWHWKIWGLR